MNDLSGRLESKYPTATAKEARNPMSCENPTSNPKHAILKRIVKRLRAAGRSLCSGRDAGPMQLAIVIPLPDEIAHEVVKLQLSILRQYGTHEGEFCLVSNGAFLPAWLIGNEALTHGLRFDEG